MGVMHQDDGGCRGNTAFLDQKFKSAANNVESLGTTSFVEPQSLVRHEWEDAHNADEMRKERKDKGRVGWRKEKRVPDVGGLGWRTKQGHLLKNQAYYTQLTKVNKWDLPTHAGVNTWQEWHGPKMRTDAEMMERLDHFDKMKADEEARKLFVNTSRTDTLDRFYNQKCIRSQLESSTNWAPHLRAKKEFHDCHDHFFGDLDSKPEAELRKVFT